MPDNAAILKELGIQRYVPRDAVLERPSKAHHPIAVITAEAQHEFSPLHQEQLKKIMDYLGYTADQYPLIHHDSDADFTTTTLLQFGVCSRVLLGVSQTIQTHSISDMLNQPSCKRQVMHDIAPLKS